MMKKKILAVVGARPQFVKAAAIVRAYQKSKLSRFFTIQWVHTGQHYDYRMSDIFYSGLKLPPSKYHLGVGSCPPAVQVAKMMEALEPILLREKPDLLLVFGDTNSTLAGALAGKLHHIPIAHVEAGLRSFDARMPEEINRVLTDRMSSLLFCPTTAAVAHLKKEGLVSGVHWTGDVMADLLYEEVKALKLKRYVGDSYLATIHRNTNTDNPVRLKAVFSALMSLDASVQIPLHPRTLAALKRNKAFFRKIEKSAKLVILPPVSYHELLKLLYTAKGVITDSGGLQKEAFLAGVPCVTLRETTEWTETVDSGRNCLSEPKSAFIEAAFKRMQKKFKNRVPPLFGRGDASYKILAKLKTFFKANS